MVFRQGFINCKIFFLKMLRLSKFRIDLFVTASKRGRNKQLVFTDSRYICTPINIASSKNLRFRNLTESKRTQIQPKNIPKTTKNLGSLIRYFSNKLLPV